LADIDHFAQFVRGTKAPPRDSVVAASAAAQTGHQIFENIGCASCHVSTVVTASPGTVIDGGAFTIPDALGNKIIHPYSDFLLHDIETGDGIVQNPPEDTAKASSDNLFKFTLDREQNHPSSWTNVAARHKVRVSNSLGEGVASPCS